MAASVHPVDLTHPSELSRDWRVGLGLVSTAVWLSLGFAYIVLQVGWRGFVSQPVDALGGFLEGAFAPLAFLWLVIGSFLQQRELRQNNLSIRAQYEEMRRTAENTEIQARAVEANALHQQQETIMMVADRVQRQVGGVMGLLWMSSQASDDGDATVEQVHELWNQLGSGDPDNFARQMMAIRYRADDLEAQRYLFFGTEVRARHSQTIRNTFDRLLVKVRDCDPDGVIEDALLGSSNGRIYNIICELDPASS